MPCQIRNTKKTTINENIKKQWEEFIKEYKVLREKTKQKVAHAEHTALILDNEVIVTTK